MRPSWPLLVAFGLPAMLLSGCASSPQSLSSPPEHYGALDPWISGVIAEVTEGGGRVRLVPIGSFDLGNREGSGSEAPSSRQESTWLELRYAKGWVYLDPVDGGAQEQVTLRQGRERFAIGQQIAIGRSADRRGGYDRQAVHSGAPSATGGGTELRFHGWILVRVTEITRRLVQPRESGRSASTARNRSRERSSASAPSGSRW